jgi:hypothetical protein
VLDLAWQAAGPIRAVQTRVRALIALLHVAGLAACAAPEAVVTDEPTEDDEEHVGQTGAGEQEDETGESMPSGQPVQLVPGCTAHATLAGFETWFHFVRPDKPCTGMAGSGKDYHAIVELIRLIDSVPSGGRIDGHIYNITIDSVGKALYDAQMRGVDVRLSTDGQVATSSDPVKTLYLDKINGVVYCASSTNRACVSTATDAISHTKLFVFSTAFSPELKSVDKVVWFGSANQTNASGTNLYNNTVTVYGDVPLYDLMRDYLDDLRARVRSADYYDPTSGRGHLLAQSADVYVSPETQTDLVVNRLDDVTPDANCAVRVMHASIRDSRMAVVDRLVTMKGGGCKVYVVASEVEPDALAALKGAGIPVRQFKIHDKVIVVHGKYGTAYQYRVYTGSHNLSISANQKYDEIFVKLAPETDASHVVYDEYVTHFNDAYNVATPL